MRPSSGNTIYRPDLGELVMDYHNGGGNFVSQQIMPVYPVADIAGGFPVIPAEAMLTIPDTKRAPRGAFNRSDYEYEDGKYSCSENGHEEPMDDGERKMLDRRAPGAADRIATMRGLRIISGSQERRVAGKIFNDTNFTAHAVDNEWDDAVNSVPITDVNDGISDFRSQCGMMPNGFLITWTTFQAFKSNGQIIDRLKYTFPGIDINKMTSDQLSALFDVPVILCNSVHNSADKGQAKNITDIWDNEFAALVRISTSPDLTEPCIGRTFVYDSDSASEPIVESYREEQITSDVLRVRHTTDERLLQSFDKNGAVVSDIAGSCCYLFSNVTTK